MSTPVLGVLTCFLAAATTVSSLKIAQAESKTEELIVLNSALGEELLFNSQAREDYLPLSLKFETQDNLAYCGVATFVMILNALNVEAPVAPNHTIPGFVTYRFFTQEILKMKKSIMFSILN